MSIWEVFAARAGETFYTAGRGSKPGKPFTYEIKGGEMFVSRKKKAITKATVTLAFDRTVRMNGSVPGPKALRVFGASYLYPVFVAIGAIQYPVKTEKKGEWNMPRGRKKVVPQTIEEKIEALEQELAALKETVSAKETELKNLRDMRNEQLVHNLMDAIAASGKSVQEVIDLVKGE